MTPPKPRIKPMTPGIPHAARVRAYLAGFVVTAGLTGVAWRAWALQVGEGDKFAALAARQHALTVDIPAPRGDVLDTKGRPLAVSADADSIWANPRDIHDVTDTADKLAKLIGGDAAALEAKLAGDRRFVWIDRHVAPERAKIVREAHLPGIEVAKEPRRWYPARTIGGTVVGRSDIDGNGVEGIELAMNAQLQGHHGEGTAVRDARGKKMFADGLDQPDPGASVHLSLDRSIQEIAETALAEAVTTNKAKNGTAVVLDVATSRVLAMASYPPYDPNSGEHQVGARNRVVADSYEAGSVMKLFSVAAALDDGAVKPDTEFDVQMGQMQIGAHVIRDVHYDKYLTVAGIIKRSSNVGAAKIALRLGRDKLYAALKRFGFGGKTGIELPGEQAGSVRDGAHWRDVELGTISFGYGITVTPLQIAAGVAAIGNGGKWTAPRIVDEIVDADGTVLYRAAPPSRTIMSEQTAAQVRTMMGSVFEGGKQNGTASTLVVPGFRCGGKTGTANKYDPETHHYALDRYLSSFVGLAPLEHPRLAIAVLIDDPTGGDHYGGSVAGPVFATVASEALRYLGVPGGNPVCPPPVPGAPPSIAPKTCIAPPGQPAAKPAPKPVPPAAAEPMPFDFTPDPEPVIAIPDFRGMGVARAIATARAAGIAVEVRGGGRVVSQDPAPRAGRGGPLHFDPPTAVAVDTAPPPRVTLQLSDGASPEH